MAVVAAALLVTPVAGDASDTEGSPPQPGGTPPLKPEAIIIRPEPSGLRTSVWTDRARYLEGDRVRVSFYVSERAHVYIYDLDTTGRVRLIFPSRYEMDNHVNAGTHTIPGRPYSLIVSGPPGAEYLQIIATRTPLKDLTPASAFVRSPFPQLGKNGPEVKAKVEGMLRAHGEGWAAAWTAFWVVSPAPPPPPPPPAPPPQDRRGSGIIRIYGGPAGRPSLR